MRMLNLLWRDNPLMMSMKLTRLQQYRTGKVQKLLWTECTNILTKHSAKQT